MKRRFTLTFEVESVRAPDNFEDIARECVRVLNQFDPHSRFWKGDPFVVERPPEEHGAEHAADAAG